MYNVYIFKKAKQFISIFFVTLLLFQCNAANEAADRLLFGITEAQPVPGVTVNLDTGDYIVPENPTAGVLKFSYVLNAAPALDININLELSTETLVDATLDKPKLTFNADNWNIPQQIIITGIDNYDVDGNRNRLLINTLQTDDPEYQVVTLDNISIIVMDDDSYSIVASPTSITTYEAGAPATSTGATPCVQTFNYRISARPTANVVVNLQKVGTAEQIDEGTFSPTTITFLPSDFPALPAAPTATRTITVTCADDFALDGNVSYSIQATSISAPGDTNFDNLPTSSVSTVSVTNVDDDTPGVVVKRSDDPAISPSSTNISPDGSLSINESTASAATSGNRFKVYLRRAPTSNVVINLTVTGVGASRIASIRDFPGNNVITSLTFTPGNYATAQEVTVLPVDDLIANDNTSAKITLATITGSNGYEGQDPADVDINIIDNDTPGVEVVQLNRNVIESTLQDAFFRLRLTSQPTADVTIQINDVFNSGASGIAVKPSTRLGTVDKTSVTFTSANWNTYQDVTFTPVNDNIADGNIQFLIELKNCISTDPKYSDRDVSPDITVNYTDNDVAGFVIVANNQVGGGTSTTTTANSATTISGFATDDSARLDPNSYSRWTIKLRTQPLASVVLTLASNSTTNDGTLSTSTLTFTTSNWNTPQEVTVTGASNATNEGNKEYTVSVSNVTGDDAYANGNFGYRTASIVARPSFSIFSCDNDVNNVIVGCRRSGGFTTSEGGGSATLWFITKDAPTGNVCVPVSSSNTAEGTVTSPATITSSNYNTMTSGGSNKVVATGVDDGSFDGNTAYTLNIGVPDSSCGSAPYAPYTSFDPPNETIRNVDNDQALVFNALQNASESGTQGQFQVRLGSAPAADATFTLSCGNAIECSSLSPTSVTITSANNSVTITVTPNDDTRADNTQPITINFGAISSTDPNIDQITPPSASPINNLDNDKVVWVITSPKNPNFNVGLTQADSYCNDAGDANKPSWGTYKALVGTASRNPSSGWILLPSTRYFLKTGSAPYTTALFQTNSSSIYNSASLSNAFGPGGDTYWSGFNSDWTVATNNCVNFTQNDAGPAFPTGGIYETTIGIGGTTGSGSINNGISDCQTTTTRKIICVQQ
ncbi:MAG: DUF1554 domain-containing protein [Leptospira sp.]|nr:DUF1554 domain-containing protein [Leptospira sp.]